jgi:hypothetical protein
MIVNSHISVHLPIAHRVSNMAVGSSKLMLSKDSDCIEATKLLSSFCVFSCSFGCSITLSFSVDFHQIK